MLHFSLCFDRNPFADMACATASAPPYCAVQLALIQEEANSIVHGPSPQKLSWSRLNRLFTPCSKRRRLSVDSPDMESPEAFLPKPRKLFALLDDSSAREDPCWLVMTP